MYDVVELIGQGTVIQHGKHNNRVYLMKLDERDAGLILGTLSELANTHGYAKLFCKVPKKWAPLFLADGFVLEAFIPGFYNNTEDAFFVSKFKNGHGLLPAEKQNLANLSTLLTGLAAPRPDRATGYTTKLLNDTDAERIAAIYREVFESYPFPVHDPAYIRKTMHDNVRYFGALKDGVLVALASSEMDVKGGNAEMTDFATLPLHTGKGIAKQLLTAMEREMKNLGIGTLYTIARLNSLAMNKTFLRLAYQYTGTLVRNTNIAGDIECMNVLYKQV